MITFQRNPLDIIDPDGGVKAVCRDIPSVCRALFASKPRYLKKNSWAEKARLHPRVIDSIQDDLPGTNWCSLVKAASALDLELRVVVVRTGTL